MELEPIAPLLAECPLTFLSYVRGIRTQSGNEVLPSSPSVIFSSCDSSRPCKSTSVLKSTVAYFRECPGAAVVRRRRWGRNVGFQSASSEGTVTVRQPRTGWQLSQAQLLACLPHLSCQVCSSPGEAGDKSRSPVEDKFSLSFMRKPTK